MPKKSIVAHRASCDALGVLGNQIRLARHNRNWTIAELSTRLGVNPRTVSAIESGVPTVAIGTVFNAAVLVGVDLFGLSGHDLARARRAGQETLALLPEKVRTPLVKEGADDFSF